MTAFGVLVAAGLFDTVLKATLLLAAGLAVVHLARRAPATWRLRVLLIVLTGAVALPLLSAVLPGLSLPVLPDPLRRSTSLPAAWAPEAAQRAPVVAQHDAQRRVVPDDSGFLGSPVAEAITPARLAVPSPAMMALPHGVRPLEVAAASCFALWFFGLVWSLSRQRAAHLRVRVLERSARVEIDPRMIATLELAATRVGIDRAVQLLVTDQMTGPMTWGHREPVILLPADHREWSAERRAVVLQHELFHIKRGDWLVRVAARAACALYWFHPLAWMALERVVEEQEHACDAQVLALGTRATSYAQHLLALARRADSAESIPLPALPMARRHLLEVRLMSILDANAKSHARSAAPALLMLLLFVAMVPALAAVEPWMQEPETQTPKTREAAHAELSEVVRQIERVEEQLRPHEARLEEIEAELHPSEEALEEVEVDMAPYEEKLEAIAREMQPFEVQLAEIEARLEPHEAMLQEVEVALEPFEARMEQIEAQLAPFEQELEALESELAPFEDLMNEIEARFNDGELASGQHAFEQFEQQIEAVQIEMEPVLAEMGKVHEKLAPVMGKLAGIHLEMEPALARIEAIHTDMAPVIASMEAIHVQMEPVHLKMEAVHREMEPVLAGLENFHVDMESFHERMEEVHREMQGPLEEIERLHVRIENGAAVFVDEVLRQELASLQLDEATIVDVREAVLEVAGLNLRGNRLQLTGEVSRVEGRIQRTLSAHGVVHQDLPALSKRAARALLDLDVALD